MLTMRGVVVLCCVGWIPGFGDVAKSGGKLYKGAGKAQKAGKAWKSTNRRANKQIDDIAKRFGIDRNGFSDFIHSRKADDHRGGADNYSWKELLDLAKEYIENGGR